MNIYDADEADNGETMSEMSIAEFEEYRQTCEQVVANAKMAEKLAEDPGFKQIIMTEYFEKEPERLARLIATGRLTPAGIEGAIEDLKSIGHLNRFLSEYVQKGIIAQQELKELEEARNEAVESGMISD